MWHCGILANLGKTGKGKEEKNRKGEQEGKRRVALTPSHGKVHQKDNHGVPQESLRGLKSLQQAGCCALIWGAEHLLFLLQLQKADHCLAQDQAFWVTDHRIPCSTQHNERCTSCHAQGLPSPFLTTTARRHPPTLVGEEVTTQTLWQASASSSTLTLRSSTAAIEKPLF